MTTSSFVETSPASIVTDGRMLNVAVTGSHGLLGSAMVAALRTEGHAVNRMVRADADPLQNEFEWHPERSEIDTLGLNPIDIVLHFAGEPLYRRWTPRKMQEIRRSRVDGTRFLAETLAGLPQPPSVLLSASSIGYYGDHGNAFVGENTPPGSGFLAELSRDWELATQPAVQAGIRVVHLRFGLVLSQDGGPLPLIRKVFKSGLGGRIGKGTQYVSWVTLADARRAIRWAIAEPVDGPVNIVSPSPVTLRRFTRSLSTVLKRPAMLRIPPPIARVAGGRIVDEMLMKSTRAIPHRLEKAGFRFEASTIQAAWDSLDLT